MPPRSASSRTRPRCGASLDQLRGLPTARASTVEADLLRDERGAWAARLRKAGVNATAVRFLGMVRDFLMLDTCVTPTAPVSPATWLSTHSRPRWTTEGDVVGADGELCVMKGENNGSR
ncbi:alpha/beta hydrolase fold domain-containing protein [Streptomyces sp. NPDC056002]|uniref:alpha/beta hydrolase fold domain-containing protein n=1 Tax=Streptomyces sp. NPDC056002 TaxID=3345675 RepID=UPI0035DEDDC3